MMKTPRVAVQDNRIDFQLTRSAAYDALLAAVMVLDTFENMLCSHLDMTPPTAAALPRRTCPSRRDAA